MVPTDNRPTLVAAAPGADVGVARARASACRRPPPAPAPKGAFGVVVLLLCAWWASSATAGAVRSQRDPRRDQLAPPSSEYLFGTDEVGRDILSRVMYSARPSMAAGLVTVVLAAIIGTITGLAAATRVGFDSMVMR